MAILLNGVDFVEGDATSGQDYCKFGIWNP